MFTKSLLTACALAAGILATQPEAAQAKANVDINVYLPGGGIGYYPGYHGRPGYYSPGYGYPVYAPGKISCFQGKQSLKWKGFRQIAAFDCAGKLYGYTARKNGNFYKVRLNSFSGHVVGIKKI
jgi:hypothetical protein